MAERDIHGRTPEEYDETVDPENPPINVLRPQVRRAALWVYLGPLVAITAFVGIALLYWVNRDSAPEQEVAPAIGTTGDQTPGGFQPDPQPGGTREELERRGTGVPPQGPMPGLAQGPLTSVGVLAGANAEEMVGRRVDVREVRVADARETGMFWIEEGTTRIAVMAPPDSPAVRTGMHVNVSGVLEADDQGGLRIRATSIQTTGS